MKEGAPGNGDALYVNGVIHTVNPRAPKASALAVSRGRIVYAGADPDEGAARLAALGRCARRIDLRGRTVVPGLADSHLHLKVQGLRLAEPDIAGKSREEILRLVAQEAARLGPGVWIQGRGWNNEHWPGKAWPDKGALDQAAPLNPVALARSDAHSLWVNSKALEAAGIFAHTPEPRGGEIWRDASGEPSGILVDTPIFQVWAAMPEPDAGQTLAACLAAQRELFGLGLTSVGDAWQSLADFALLKSAYEDGRMKLRVHAMLATTEFADNPALLDELAPVAGLFDGRLSLAACKLVLDGSLGSRSAWLSREYADRPGHRASGRYGDEELFSLAERAAARGFQLCCHAIGDEAVAQALRLFARLPRPAGGLPGRIEHFQIASREQVARALELGVICAMQTIHCRADWDMAGERLDPELLGRAYPWRDVLDAGGVLANGSDSPMEDGNPFHGFAAAVTRPSVSAPGGERPVALCREEALKSYTLWAAMAEGAHGFKGSLEAGKAADFAVLDRDIMACPEEDIAATRVLATVLAGEVVFGGV